MIGVSTGKNHGGHLHACAEGRQGHSAESREDVSHGQLRGFQSFARSLCGTLHRPDLGNSPRRIIKLLVINVVVFTLLAKRLQ